MKKYEVKKGINLFMARDNKFQDFRACVMIHRPLTKKEVTMNSLLTAVARMQSKHFEDSTAISCELENLYGAELIARTGKYGENLMIKIGIQSSSDEAIGEKGNFDRVMRLLFDVAFCAGKDGEFSKQITDNEKKNIKDAILAQKNDKRSYSVLRLQEEMCKEEPYGINPVGYIELLEKTDEKSLYEHYLNVLQESRIDIIFTGNFDEECAKKAVLSYTGFLPERSNELSKSAICREVKQIKTVTDKMDVTQGKLCIGFRCPENTAVENYPAVIVYNTVFGGSATSKLFENVREKLSLCYYVSSSIDRLKEIMIVRSGVEFADFDKAYNEIMVQQQKMIDGEITDEEIIAAKKQLINAYNSNYDSISAIGEYYTMQLLLGTNVSIEEMIEQVEKVTKEDIVNVANGMKQDTIYFLRNEEAE